MRPRTARRGSTWRSTAPTACWTLKSLTFGDRQWERPTTLALGLGTWGVLSLYWIAPYLIVSRGVEAPPWFLGLAIATYAFGVFFHFASDLQKHVALGLRPGVLVTGGLWSRTRPPERASRPLLTHSDAQFSGMSFPGAPGRRFPGRPEGPSGRVLARAGRGS